MPENSWQKIKKTVNKLLKKKKGDKEDLRGYTIKEIAEGTSSFPGDIEKAVKALQKQGKVKIYWYDGEMYVVAPVDIDWGAELNEGMMYA